MTCRIPALILLCVFVGCSPSDLPAQANTESDELTAAEELDDGAEDLDWRTEFAAMSQVLQLTEDETNQLSIAFELRDSEIRSWMNANGSKLRQLEKQMRTAAKAKDLSGVRTATSQATPLRNERRKLVDHHRIRIRSTLSAENQLVWSAHLLCERLIDLMQDVSLTAQQIDQINAQALVAVQDAVGQKNPDAFGYLELERFAERQILTADQLSVWEPITKKHPMRSLY